jgi:O-antigen ligase
MFKQYYLKGVGVRNFRNECKKDIYKKVGTYHCSTHPHNTYLQILSETGLIGFLFFMIFLGFIFVNIFQYLKNIYIKHEKINITLGLCFVFILVNFFPLSTTGSFFNNWLSTLYFMPISFLLYELNYKKFK